MKKLLLALSLLSCSAYAYDTSVTHFVLVTSVPGIPSPLGGMVDYQPGTTTPWAVWIGGLNESGTQAYEAYACQGSFNPTFQCTSSVTCLTCGNAPTFFGGGYANNSVYYNAPQFDPTGNFVGLGANNAGLVSTLCQTAANGGTAAVGNGICFKYWMFPFIVTGGVPSLGSPVAVTTTPNAYNGALMCRLMDTSASAGYVACAYRTSASGTGSCALGAWEIRAWNFTTTGVPPSQTFSLGSEITAVATNTAAAYNTCQYMEASGFIDPLTYSMVYEVAPGTNVGTTPGQNFWNNRMDVVQLTGSNSISTLYSTSTTVSSNTCLDWQEHAVMDPTYSRMILASSHGSNQGDPNSATAYNPCQLAGSFTSVPLDAWSVPLVRTGCGNASPPYCTTLSADSTHARRMTFFNTNSTDRTFGCSILLNNGCTGANANVNISLGYRSYKYQDQVLDLIKVNVSGALVSWSPQLVTTIQ